MDTSDLCGLLVLPPGTPPDERIEVVLRTIPLETTPYARSLDAMWSEFARASPEEDGAFCLPLPPPPCWMRVEVDSRLLHQPPKWLRYLDGPPRVRPSWPLVLEPTLTGTLHFRWILPPESKFNGNALVGRRVMLMSMQLPGKGVASSSSPERELEIGPGLEIVADRLVPGREYYIAGDHAPFARASLGYFGIEPGSTTEAEIELIDGLLVRGRVVDEAGSPVQGAKVRVTGNAHWGTFAEGGETAQDGMFAIEGVHPDVNLVEVQRTGFVPLRWNRDAPDAEGSLDDLFLVMIPTRSFHVRVLLPDGRPVQGAFVKCVARAGERRDWEDDWLVGTNAIGEAEIGALPPGEYDLTAGARLPICVESVDGQRVRALIPPAEGLDWRAAREGVQSGAETIEFVLDPPPDQDG